MPTKHNKIRYKAAMKPRPEMVVSGNVFLQYRDDDKIAAAGKGDIMLYPSVEALHTIRRGEYENKGYSGYLKMDVYNGKEWLPLLPQDFFAAREQYFSKTERPLDTFHACEEILRPFQGRKISMSYREHYKLINNESENS